MKKMQQTDSMKMVLQVLFKSLITLMNLVQRSGIFYNNKDLLTKYMFWCKSTCFGHFNPAYAWAKALIYQKKQMQKSCKLVFANQ